MKTYRGEHCRNKLFIWLVVAVVIIQFITPASDMVKATDTSSSFIVGEFTRIVDNYPVQFDLMNITEMDSSNDIMTFELNIHEDLQPQSITLVMQHAISPIKLDEVSVEEQLDEHNYEIMTEDSLPSDYFGNDYSFYTIHSDNNQLNNFVFDLQTTGVHIPGDLIGVVIDQQYLAVIDQASYLSWKADAEETTIEETLPTETVVTDETTIAESTESTQETDQPVTEETIADETLPTEPVSTGEISDESIQPTEPVVIEETTLVTTQATETIVSTETTSMETKLTETIQEEFVSSESSQEPVTELVNNIPAQPEEFYYEDEQIIIRAEISDSSLLPIGTEFVVFPIKETNSEFSDFTQAVEEQFSQSVVRQLLYDISFVNGLEVIQPPEQAVKIIIELKDQEFQNALQEEYSLEVVHIAETETEVVNAEVLVENEEVRGLEFAAESFSPYSVVLLSHQLIPGTYGNYNYSHNDTRNSFISDETYAKYRNDNNTLGIAGNFHIVAFDTARLNTHTNGNVLANTLFANVNFGTNNLANELSYIVNYAGVNGGSASSSNHVLVIGHNHNITTVDNGNHLAINGTQLDRPDILIQDVNSTDSPFIDVNEVKQDIAKLSAELASIPDIGVTKNFSDINKLQMTLNNPNSAGYISMKAAGYLLSKNLSGTNIPGAYESGQQVTVIGGDGHTIKLQGFESGKNGSIIINVDAAGTSEITLPNALIYIDGIEQGVNEVTTFENGKVIWNFINAENTTIITNRMTGMVIAPGANVIIKQNLNGTVVAENITVDAESHRTDFTGTLIPHKIKITMEKVWEGGAPATPTDISFKLQRSLAGTGDYDDVEGSSQTLKSSDENQTLTWVDLPSENNEYQAYEYLVVELTDLQNYEEQAPVLIPEYTNAYLNYYRVVNQKIEQEPMFFYIDKVDEDGIPLSSGIISFIIEGNSKLKEITYDLSEIQRDLSGDSLGYKVDITEAEWPAGEYTLREIRAPAGFVLSEKLYGITIDYENRLITWHDPPDGKEIILYSETGGETTTSLTIVNHRLRLPETGGPGIKLYLVLGVLLMTATLILQYKNKTKEDRREKLQQVKEGKKQ